MSAPKDTHSRVQPEAAPCLYNPTQLRSFECRRNLYRLSNLALQYTPHIGVDGRTTVLRFPASQDAGSSRVGHAFFSNEEKSQIFQTCLLDGAKPWHRPAIHLGEARDPGYSKQSLCCTRREDWHEPAEPWRLGVDVPSTCLGARLAALWRRCPGCQHRMMLLRPPLRRGWAALPLWQMRLPGGRVLLPAG